MGDGRWAIWDRRSGGAAGKREDRFAELPAFACASQDLGQVGVMDPENRRGSAIRPAVVPEMPTGIDHFGWQVTVNASAAGCEAVGILRGAVPIVAAVGVPAEKAEAIGRGWHVAVGGG